MVLAIPSYKPSGNKDLELRFGKEKMQKTMLWNNGFIKNPDTWLHKDIFEFDLYIDCINVCMYNSCILFARSLMPTKNSMVMIKLATKLLSLIWKAYFFYL